MYVINCLQCSGLCLTFAIIRSTEATKSSSNQTCNRGLSVVAAHSAVAVALVLILLLEVKRGVTGTLDQAVKPLGVCCSVNAKQGAEWLSIPRSRRCKAGLAELKREKDRAGNRCLGEQMLLRRVQTVILLDETQLISRSR